MRKWAKRWAPAAFLLVFSMAARGVASHSKVSEKELADKLKLYASISTLEVGFKQTKTLKDMDLQLKSEGKLKLRRPDQVIWEVTQPSPLVVTLNKDEVKIRSGRGADTQTQTLKLTDAPSDQAQKSLTGLIAWLSLDSHALTQQYDVFSEEKDTYLFQPKQKDTPFQSLSMNLGSDGQLKHLTIQELSGDTLNIDFGKPKLSRK